MSRRMKWGLSILFLGVVVVLLNGKLAWLESNTASLKISNRSAIEITDIQVSIHDQPCEFKRLLPGDSVVCNQAIKADGHYRISWREVPAGNYREQAGYVTRGFDFNHELDFLGSGKIDFNYVENY